MSAHTGTEKAKVEVKLGEQTENRAIVVAVAVTFLFGYVFASELFFKKFWEKRSEYHAQSWGKIRSESEAEAKVFSR